MVTLATDEEMICPACGGSEWKNWGQTKDYSISGEWFELKECTSCRIKATHPQPAADQLSRYYASTDYISHSDTDKGLTNKLYHKAREYMMRKKYEWVTGASNKKTGRLLDIGAGTGHFAKYMQDREWEVIGLEPDENARKVAAEKLKLHLFSLDTIAKLKPEHYDVITLWHVLEHVPDLSATMAQIKTLLMQDGVLFIAVPNHTSRDAGQYGTKWAAYDVPRHLWHFSPLSIEKLLSRHGFKLAQKITMPLDAFYVSMLSEKYKGNNFFGPASALLSGIRTLLSGNKDVNKASSIIYVAKFQ